MKNSLFGLMLLLMLVLISCSEKTDYGQPNVSMDSFENDFKKWWTYYHRDIDFSSDDFIALDVNNKVLKKGRFLQKLITGDYIPLKLENPSHTYYQLFKLPKSSRQVFGKVMANQAAISYEKFTMEGQDFPAFSFSDLNGQLYTNENTKGNILVFKTWFIGCQACVYEFPQLNNLVKKYKSQEDVLFISMAQDDSEALKLFLEKKPFRYAVIPKQTKFMNQVLNVREYPTHIIVDREGKIRKIVTSAHKMIAALEQIQ